MACTGAGDGYKSTYSVQSGYVGLCQGSVGGLAGLQISFVAMQRDPLQACLCGAAEACDSFLHPMVIFIYSLEGVVGLGECELDG